MGFRTGLSKQLSSGHGPESPLSPVRRGIFYFSGFLFLSIFINAPPCRSCRDGLLTCRFGRRSDCVPLAHGAHLFSLDEKRWKKNQVGRYLDTPSKTVPKGTGFEGGQDSFFNTGQQHRKTTLFPRVICPLPLTKRVDASTQQRRNLSDRRNPHKLEG